ncbi:MAG TPA: hypothetical protein VF377_02030 [Acidimicrobiia bacterium]
MKRLLVAIVVLALVACGTGGSADSSVPATTGPEETSTTSSTTSTQPTTTTSVAPPTTSTSTTTSTTTTAPSTSSTPSSTTPSGTDETISPDGFWEVRVGETVADNEARIGGPFDDLGGDPGSCLVLQLPEVGGVYFLATSPNAEPVNDPSNLVIGRVSTDEPGWPTDTGIEVGMSVAEAESILGDTIVERNPHTYIDGGEYLIVGEPEDRYVYETDGSEIVAIHAGREPTVRAIEACS